MPLKRFDNLPPERQTRILEAAGRQFAANGVDGQPLERVLQDAEISKPAVYYYFENKEDLFAAVVEYHVDKLLREWGWVVEQIGGDFSWDDLRAVVAKLPAEALDTHILIHRLELAWQLSREASANEAIRAQFERIDDLMRTLVARGQRSGAIRTDLPQDLLAEMYLALHAALHRWWAVQRERLTPEDAQTLAVNVVEMLRALLAPPAKSPR